MGPEETGFEPLPVKAPTCRKLPSTATKEERREQHDKKMAFKKERDGALLPGLYPGHLWRLP
jgi:hypothetical protein